ncbi:MAG: 16S rRNA (cytidine(1402)-2'-O)-methyltransferase [Synergistaceae bacterium]
MPLIIVPTPVGNLDDMTLRGLQVLRDADIIACEDTRHTLKLLNHYDIKKPLISCHEHNEIERAEELMDMVERGETVALVSDAGTPGLSDPGGKVIQVAIKRKLPYDVLPGANAMLPALLLSGLNMDSFMFVGFLKGKSEEKRKRLEEVKKIKDTLVFYISPHRLKKELEFMGNILGDRNAVLVREISKIHQETIEGTLCTYEETLNEEKIRGEFVCLVEGNKESDEIEDSTWQKEADRMIAEGESTKNLANFLSIKYCIQRNRIKRYVLNNDTEEV